MKKTHWLRTTLITLAACALAGLILAVILFNANPGRTGVSSSIEFSFDGAAEGLAPNGVRYDLSGFTSDEVLDAALEEAGLADKYTAEDLRGNIVVAGVYPKDIVEQMTGYESLLTGDASKVTVSDYHATMYTVTLYNDFDKNISRGDLEKLLTAIMGNFRTRFEKTYSVFLAEDQLLASLSDYDYPQRLEILESAATRGQGFAEEMAQKHPDFRVDGKGFADIAARYSSLKSTDLERLNGLVIMNALSVDQERITAQYENRIEILQIRLKEKEQEAKDVESLVASYNKDDILYVSTSAALQKVGGNSAETYDALITSRQEIAASISETNAELSEVKMKLSDIRGGESKAEEPKDTESDKEETEETAETETAAAVSEEERETQKAVVDKGIDNALAKLNAITEDFAEFLQAYSAREMNDSTVAVTAVKYNAPKLLSGAFIKKDIKTAGPICVLGFIVCLVCIIVSRRKEEKAKK